MQFRSLTLMAAHLLLMFPLRYIYLIYNPNLGFVVAVPGRKRAALEQEGKGAHQGNA